MSWTFLSNHGHVIVQLAKQPDIKMSDLAMIVGVTERHVRAIVNDLRQAGYVEVYKEGRRNNYRVVHAMPLRHAHESDRKLRDLLSIFRK